MGSTATASRAGLAMASRGRREQRHRSRDHGKRIAGRYFEEQTRQIPRERDRQRHAGSPPRRAPRPVAPCRGRALRSQSAGPARALSRAGRAIERRQEEREPRESIQHDGAESRVFQIIGQRIPHGRYFAQRDVDCVSIAAAPRIAVLSGKLVEIVDCLIIESLEGIAYQASQP